MPKLTLSNGSSQYGAQMGRRDIMPGNLNEVVKLRIVKLRWIDGDYDQGGAYWGRGKFDFIWCAYGEASDVCVQIFVRETCRQYAKQIVQAKFPGAIFFR